MNFDLSSLINTEASQSVREVFVRDHDLIQLLNQAAAAVAKPLEVINA